MDVTEKDLAWLAGLSDGESCVRIEKKKGKRGTFVNYRLAFEINMVHKETILRIFDILKVGSIFKKTSKNPKARISWVWKVNCSNAKIVLKLLYPYVVTKKKEFEIALQFINLLRTDKSNVTKFTKEEMKLREKLYLDLKEAKKYEWKD